MGMMRDEKTRPERVMSRGVLRWRRFQRAANRSLASADHFDDWSMIGGDFQRSDSNDWPLEPGGVDRQLRDRRRHFWLAQRGCGAAGQLWCAGVFDRRGGHRAD